MHLTYYESGGVIASLTPCMCKLMTRVLASAVLDLCSGMVREQEAAMFIFGFAKAADR